MTYSGARPASSQVVALQTEIQLQFPIPDQMLQVDFLDTWVDANPVFGQGAA